MTTGALSPWIVVPVAAVLMAIVCALQVHIARSGGPRSRRRIRTANGWVMLVAIPILAAGFCFVSPSLAPRAFLLTWAAGIGLLCIAVFLALLDMMNTWRLEAASRRETVRAFGGLLATPPRRGLSDKPGASPAAQAAPAGEDPDAR